MLYFVIALLDRWIMLINGDEMAGLGSQKDSTRIPVGFGLAYYLIGAVLLDINGQKLHLISHFHVMYSQTSCEEQDS